MVDISFIVILEDVVTTVPEILVVLILTVKVSGPYVVRSNVGVTLKLPVFELIVKLPELLLKSEVLEFIVQYRVVPSGTLEVVTLKVREDPSSTLSETGVTE